MIYAIEGRGALVNEKGEDQSLKAVDFALVDPSEKTSIATREMFPLR
jgi:hypothetical protein